MKYYFVKYLIDSVNKQHTESGVFCVDESNHLDTFLEIKKRIDGVLIDTPYVLDHIAEFREL